MRTKQATTQEKESLSSSLIVCSTSLNGREEAFPLQSVNTANQMSTTGKRKRATAKERQDRAARYPVYIDHCNRSEAWVEERRAEIASKATTTTGAKKHFPNQLYLMLSDVDGTVHSQVVRWLPHGRSFVVLDPDRFVSDVLPIYFPCQTTLGSFLRQLNSYGFLRLTHKEDGYYHELFLRGRPFMAALIPRSLRSQHSTRRRFDPSSAPNLFEMSWMPDISRPMDSSTGVSRTAETSGYAAARWGQLQLTRTLPPSSEMPCPVQNTKLRKQLMSHSQSNAEKQVNRVTVAEHEPISQDGITCEQCEIEMNWKFQGEGHLFEWADLLYEMVF